MLSLCVGIAATCNIGLNYFFIRKTGAVAAAYTSLASLLLMTVLYRLALSRICRNIFSDRYSVLYFLAVMLLCGTFIVVERNLLARYLVYSAVIMALALLAFVKRGEIKKLIKA